MRKETIINLCLIWNKTYILLLTLYGNPITRRKTEENKFHKTPSKWTYNLSIFKSIFLRSRRQIYLPAFTQTKDKLREERMGSDKIGEKRGNISPTINLRFRARALSLNPKVHRKVERVYYWRTTFSPLPLTEIKLGPSPGYGYFSGGSSEIQKDFLASAFYLNFFFFVSSFYSRKEYCY